jgi:hypothetical protein
LFWEITKHGQDAILWQLAFWRSTKKKKWSINGKSVCREAFCKLMGIGRKRLARASKTHRGRDGRSSGSQIRSVILKLLIPRTPTSLIFEVDVCSVH